MRNHWGRAIIILVVAGGVYFFWKQTSPHDLSVSQENSASPASVNGTAPSSLPSVTSKSSSSTPAEQITSPDHIARATNVPSTKQMVMSDVPPETVMENMRSTFRLYGSTFGGNPVGTNPEITSALDGHNPKQIHFIQSDSGLRINDQGELVDA